MARIEIEKVSVRIYFLLLSFLFLIFLLCSIKIYPDKRDSSKTKV